MVSAQAEKIYFWVLGVVVVVCFLSQTANLPDPIAHARPVAPAAHLFRENSHSHSAFSSSISTTTVSAAAGSAPATPDADARPLAVTPRAAPSLVERLEEKLEHKLEEFSMHRGDNFALESSLAGAEATTSSLAVALNLASLLTISNGRAVWRGDGDLLLASANGEVPLSERVFDVISTDGANEWVAFRLRSSADPHNLHGRYMEIGPPPDLNLRLQAADTAAAAAAGTAAAATTSSGESTQARDGSFSLVDHHELHFRLEGPRRHRHHPTAPRGVLRHRSTNAFVCLVAPGTLPFGTLRADPLSRRRDATIFAVNGTNEQEVAAAAQHDKAARALDAAQLASQIASLPAAFGVSDLPSSKPLQGGGLSDYFTAGGSDASAYSYLAAPGAEGLFATHSSSSSSTLLSRSSNVAAWALRNLRGGFSSSSSWSSSSSAAASISGATRGASEVDVSGAPEARVLTPPLVFAPPRISPSPDSSTSVSAQGEKWVISFGLYGANPKYVSGAMRNAELQPQIFPGWVCRFYVDDSVPESAIWQLHSLGAETVNMEGKGIVGGIAGMFWRFLVADDPTVDRFIVRDSDSRLNPRDALAVAEWVASGANLHTVRDHPNHERPLNGGMWGARRGFLKGAAERQAAILREEQAWWESSARDNDWAGGSSSSSRDDWWERGTGSWSSSGSNSGSGVFGTGSSLSSSGYSFGARRLMNQRTLLWESYPYRSSERRDEGVAEVEKNEEVEGELAEVTMASLIRGYWNKDAYGADLTFLSEVVWPLVKHDHLAHDAYSCERFENARGFPSPRPLNFQHVGQVFDGSGKSRQSDIDGFTRGVEVPEKCRRRPEWRFG